MGNITSTAYPHLYIIKMTNNSLPLVPFLHTILKYNNKTINDTDPRIFMNILQETDLTLEIMDLRNKNKFEITIPRGTSRLGINVIKLNGDIKPFKLTVVNVKGWNWKESDGEGETWKESDTGRESVGNVLNNENNNLNNENNNLNMSNMNNNENNFSNTFKTNTFKTNTFKANFKVNDKILGLENMFFEGEDEMINYIKRNVGSLVNFVIIRDGKVKLVPMELKEEMGCELKSGIFYKLNNDEYFVEGYTGEIRKEEIRKGNCEKGESKEIVREERESKERERDGNKGERDGNKGERDGNKGERDGNKGERDGNKGESDGNNNNNEIRMDDNVNNEGNNEGSYYDLNNGNYRNGNNDNFPDDSHPLIPDDNHSPIPDGNKQTLINNNYPLIPDEDIRKEENDVRKEENDVRKTEEEIKEIPRIINEEPYDVIFDNVAMSHEDFFMESEEGPVMKEEAYDRYRKMKDGVKMEKEMGEREMREREMDQDRNSPSSLNQKNPSSLNQKNPSSQPACDPLSVREMKEALVAARNGKEEESDYNLFVTSDDDKV